MKKIFQIASIVLMFSVTACSSGGDKQTAIMAEEIKGAPLANESDSLSYIIGVNIAEQLRKVDSTANLAVVCRAIMEYSTPQAVMNAEDARTNYLRYLLYVEPERRRAIEERMLADFVEGNRGYTTTKSGLVYRIDEIGDEKFTPRNAGDWLTLTYTIERFNGEEISTIENSSLALSDLGLGLKEIVKMLGKGGKAEAFLPSKLAYGEDGDEKLEIAPFETLRYKVELTNVERNAAQKYKNK